MTAETGSTCAGCKEQFALIFAQLLALRESVETLQTMEEARVRSLRGHQTVDAGEAMQLSFRKLQDDIAGIEEVLATLAEATGEIQKL